MLENVGLCKDVSMGFVERFRGSWKPGLKEIQGRVATLKGVYGLLQGPIQTPLRDALDHFCFEPC